MMNSMIILLKGDESNEPTGLSNAKNFVAAALHAVGKETDIEGMQEEN